MESNLYQAPDSEIITPESDTSGLALYVVAPWKFNLLFCRMSFWFCQFRKFQ